MKIIYTLMIIIVSITLLWSCSYFFRNKKVPMITGVIQKIYLTEVPNKAQGKAPRRETRIELQIIEINKAAEKYTSNLTIQTFIGHENLLRQFHEGDKVNITCMFNTGYRIDSILKVED